MNGNGNHNREAPQILIVDDTPVNLKLLNEMLTRHGYRVRPASSGRLALRSVAAAPPDLILLDVMMPDMDGYEVCHSLKSDEASSAIPVIFISALDSVSDKVRGFEVGGVDFITKPFQKAEVLARVETHLALHHLQLQLEDRNILLQREIEARTRFEEELKRHQEQLEVCIAERTRELNETLAKYRGIFENSVEGIFQVSPQGRFISCNPALAAILGYDGPEELMNAVSHIGEQIFVRPRRYHELIALLLSVQDVKKFEVELYRKDGSILWALANVRPVVTEEGNLLYFDSILQDVTERKLFEESLNKLSQALEQSPVSVIITDTVGKVEFVNAHFTQVSGYSLEEILGATPSILKPDIISPQVYDCIRDTLGRGEVWEGEFVNRRKNGETYPVHATISPIRNREGIVTNYLTIQEDVTDRKAAQQALLEHTRIKRELEIAQEIQQSFLPARLPELTGVRAACRCVPAANVGGDYYDFFYPDPDVLDVVIADVAGHSVGSALLMTVTRSVLHARSCRQNHPARLLTLVNDLLYEDLSRSDLLNSMFYARLDLAKRTLVYANAGHTRSQLLRAADGSLLELDAEGLLMGVKRGVFFEEKEIGVEAGDILLLHTDGINETENGDGEFFGTDRLHAIIRKERNSAPEEIIDAVFHQLSVFAGGKPHADDMTMVVIKIVSPNDPIKRQEVVR